MKTSVFPLNFPSALNAALLSEKSAFSSLASSSTTLNPMLCLVSSYSEPGFPKPTSRNFMPLFYQFGQVLQLSFGRR